MESFVFKGGEKFCNIYALIDDSGKYLYELSVRLHEAGYDHTADGSSQGRVIHALRCRANNFENKQTCRGCKMLEHYNNQLKERDGDCE